jgi:hypothetical protein
MKTKFVVLASVAMIAQVKAGDVRAGAAARPVAVAHPGTVAHAGPVARAPMRPGGISSFHPMPTRNLGGRSIYSGPRYPSFGMRSPGPRAIPQHSIYPSRVTVTRSGPFTAVSINQGNRFTRFANHRNPAVTGVWDQRNTGSNFRNGSNVRNANNYRNGNHRLRGNWQKHVFAHQSGDWQRDWNHNSDHWWNGHRCCFINGSWVIFNLGYDPWWPWAWSPPDYFANGSPDSSYDDPSYGYANPYSYDYQPNYDQNDYSDQSQDYYDSMVYQNEVDSDQNANRDYSPNEIVVAAQERLARQGYYHGETDGTFSPEMLKAVRNYQITNGLPPSGYLDTETLSVMGLQGSPSY